MIPDICIRLSISILLWSLLAIVAGFYTAGGIMFLIGMAVFWFGFFWFVVNDIRETRRKRIIVVRDSLEPEEDLHFPDEFAKQMSEIYKHPQPAPESEE